MRSICRKFLPVIVMLTATATVFATHPASATESFFIGLPTDGIAMTHGGEVALAAGPPGIALLQETKIRNGFALLAKVRDVNDVVIGFASELETFPTDSDMLSESVIWDTSWTVMIPGRGSLYLQEQEIMRQAFLSKK